MHIENIKARTSAQLLLLLLFLTFLGPSSKSGAAAEMPGRVGKIRWAYYVAYDATSLNSLRDHIGSLNYLSPWWFKIDGGGNIISAGDREVEDAEIDAVMALARSKGVKALPMLKNAPQGQAFHKVLADAATRGRAIDNILELVASRNYDGINIDFEGISAEDRDNLTQFMYELAPKLRAQGKLVTQALPAKTEERLEGWTGAFDYGRLGQINDLVLVMAYGYKVSSSPTPGSTAPISWVEAITSYALTIPQEKLILGVPWYGFDWNKTKGPPARALTYAQAIALAQQHGATIEYDENQESPHFSYVHEGEEHEVWFEDRRSMEAKLTLVEKYGLAGAGGWRMGHEDPASWQAFDARLGLRTWFLAEGSTGRPYDTWILIMNPNQAQAQIRVTFMKEDGSTLVKSYTLAPTSRFNLFANQVLPNAAFSTKIESDQPILVERAMYFGHDGHVSKGVNAPSRTWYLPEGYTGPGTHTWILLMNPNPAPAKAEVTFLRESGPPLTKSYTLRPTSRLNLWANQLIPDAAFSTLIKSDQPLVAERASYFDGGKGGHGSVGSPYASKYWRLAEGYTGHETWLLFMNPNPEPVSVEVFTIRERGGTWGYRYTLPANSRFTLRANNLFEGEASFSVEVFAPKPIVVERASYWGGSTSGHSSLAASASARTWYFPESSTAWPFDDWLLMLNPTQRSANVTLTLMAEGGAIMERQYLVGARARQTFHLNDILPNAAFSVRVDSDQPIVAERSMYFGGGGHNSVGFPQ